MKKKIFWSIKEEESKEEQGFLKINNKVIASISALAALEIKGVARLGHSFKDKLKSTFSQKIYYQGVTVEFNRNNELKLTLYLVIEYGTNLSELANAVQLNVRSTLEKMADIIPSEVNVIVQKVEKPKQGG